MRYAIFKIPVNRAVSPPLLPRGGWDDYWAWSASLEWAKNSIPAADDALYQVVDLTLGEVVFECGPGARRDRSAPV